MGSPATGGRGPHAGSCSPPCPASWRAMPAPGCHPGPGASAAVVHTAVAAAEVLTLLVIVLAVRAGLRAWGPAGFAAWPPAAKRTPCSVPAGSAGSHE